MLSVTCTVTNISYLQASACTARVRSTFQRLIVLRTMPDPAEAATGSLEGEGSWSAGPTAPTGLQRNPALWGREQPSCLGLWQITWGPEDGGAGQSWGC